MGGRVIEGRGRRGELDWPRKGVITMQEEPPVRERIKAGPGEAMPPALCVEAGDGQDRAPALGWG